MWYWYCFCFYLPIRFFKTTRDNVLRYGTSIVWTAHMRQPPTQQVSIQLLWVCRHRFAAYSFGRIMFAQVRKMLRGLICVYKRTGWKERLSGSSSTPGGWGPGLDGSVENLVHCPRIGIAPPSLPPGELTKMVCNLGSWLEELTKCLLPQNHSGWKVQVVIGRTGELHHFIVELLEVNH